MSRAHPARRVRSAHIHSGAQDQLPTKRHRTAKRDKGKGRAVYHDHQHQEQDQDQGHEDGHEDEDDDSRSSEREDQRDQRELHDERDGLEEEEEDEVPMTSARVLRGWETRRARAAEARQRAEDLIHPSDGFGHGGPSTPPLPHPSPRPTAPLPSSDLLTALQHHASTFYTAHGLLLPPSEGSGKRKHAWGSKKRLLILHDASSASHHSADFEEEEEQELDGGGAGDQHGEGDAEQGELVRIKKEYVDSHGEIMSVKRQRERKAKAKARTDGQEFSEGEEGGEPVGDESRAWRHGRKARAKGKYKLRDMRRSLDGSALMALGMLTQEIIIRKLREAGYAPSPAKPSKAKSDKRKKKRKRTDADADAEESRNGHVPEEEEDSDGDGDSDNDADADADADGFLAHQVQSRPIPDSEDEAEYESEETS